MISQTVRLVSTAALRPSLSRPPSRGGIIGLPNPLKALMVTHSGVTDKPVVTESTGRIEVDGQVERGLVLVEGTIIANRTIPTNDGIRVIFWTEVGLIVGPTTNNDVHSLSRFRLFKHNPVTSR